MKINTKRAPNLSGSQNLSKHTLAVGLACDPPKIDKPMERSFKECE